ncbi:hypothetical protein ACO2Q2_09055 [Dyella sp. KRB-257]|uniref:hypothetical protein n=1 Tax=Dyella sp. KRB-257 TaxID=3400915 RepID=UPI003C06E3ED
MSGLQKQNPPSRAGFATARQTKGGGLHRHPSINVRPIERFLSAHEAATGHHAQRTSKGARITCAVCGTKSYKGAATEGDNGTVLLHFFCGHSVQENLHVIGLEMGDLFVRRDLRTMTPIERSQLRQAAMLPRWRAALEVLTHEAAVVLIAANKMGDGEALDDDELTRMRVAALKVFDCGEVLNERT